MIVRPLFTFYSILAIVYLLFFPSQGIMQEYPLISGSVEQSSKNPAGSEFMLSDKTDASLTELSLQSMVTPSVSASDGANNAFKKWNRYPAEEREWIDMPNTTSYFRDVLVGAVVSAAGANHGDTWHFVVTLPGGSNIISPTIWYYETWYGEHFMGGTSCATNGCYKCFVYQSWYVCGTSALDIQWWVSSQCIETGDWLWEFYYNDSVWHWGETTHTPTIPPDKVPLDGQIKYSDPYDSLCYDPTLWKHPDYYYTCGPDSANHVLISDEGCFLTAATMMLGYHGINVTPPQLDQWLVANGGYTLKGFVDPFAVARYARDVANVEVTYQKVIKGKDFDSQICTLGPQITALNGGRHWVPVTGTDFSKQKYYYNDSYDGTKKEINRNDVVGETHKFAGPSYFYTDHTSIAIWFNSPGELVMTDPQGRRTGYDPITDITYDEIPEASYSFIGQWNRDSGIQGSDVAKMLTIFRPVVGEYELTVHGTGNGTYTMEVRAYDADSNLSTAILEDIPITEDQVQTFGIEFDKVAGSTVKLNGIYTGNGQRPRDVNQFLSFVNLAASRTDLPTGTTKFDLTILYGSTVIPSTLNVRLNSADVTYLFNPIAGEGEVVTIDLTPGRNVLIFSIDGMISEKVTTDKDRIVLDVQ